MKSTGPATVDEYLAEVPSVADRTALSRLRTLIREAAPEAVECISYGMPGYKLNGYLAGFAAFKNHCSFFPGAIVADFANELKPYKTSKGTVQFSPEDPLPEALVKAMIAARVAELAAKRRVS